MWPGLWWALLAVWPRKDVPHPNPFADSYAAQAVRLGGTDETVADAWAMGNVDSARSKIQRGGKEPLAAPVAYRLVGG